MKKIKIISIILLFVAGVGIMLYPVYKKMITEKKQDEMISKLDKQIEKNKKNKSETDEKIKATYDPELVKKEMEALEIEQNDSEVQVSDNDKLLENQKVIGTIEISKIDVKYAIVEGSNRANIAVAIGHMKGTSSIGGEGNCVLAGHNGGIYGKFFKNLNQLSKGDKVVLTDEYGDKYTYEVYEMFKVKPEEVSVTENKEGYVLTLITCQDNGKTRLIVRCKIL